MKKYIVLALMPFIFVNNVCAKDAYEDIDAIIINELRAAQKAMHSNTSLTLKTILHALVSFGKKTGNRMSAIAHIFLIEKALLVCKSEQYNPAWYDVCEFFSSKPEIVTKQIEPALKEVDKALADLKVNQFEWNDVLKVFGLSTVSVIITLAGLKAVGTLSEYKDVIMDNLAYASKNRKKQRKYNQQLRQAALAKEYSYPSDFSRGDVVGDDQL